MNNNLIERYNLLLDSVDKGDISTIKDLIDKNYINGLPLKEMRNFVVAPLKYAIESKEYNIIKLLLESGADINSLSNWIYGYDTPIQHAIIKAMDSYNSYGTPTRETNIIELLLSYNCDTNILDGKYKTALDIAIELNHYEAIELVKFHNGKTLEEFNSDKYREIIKYNKLLDSCTYMNFKGVELNREEKKQYLANNLSSENINGVSFHETNYLNTPLNYAIESFNYEIIKYLLEKGANPNLECLWKYGYYSPIFILIFSFFYNKNGDDEDIEDLINLFLEYGVNINTHDKTFNETPLDIVIFLKDEFMINYLKSLGAKTSEELEQENK